jgi:hypothetical protein
MTDELLRDFYRGNLGGPDTDDGSMLQETPDDSLGEAFSSGLVAGVEGLGTSLDYFQALIGTAIGDDQMAEDNIAEAKVGEAISVGAMAGIQEFGEFLENPSVTGALTQVASFGGQGVPSLIYSIGSLATGGIGGAAVGVAVQTARKKAASRLVKDLLEDVTKGKGSKRDLADAQAIYDHAKSEAKRQGAKYGAYTGAAASEYPSLAGENFGEALGAGQERDRSTAFRAAAVAVPQTAIGVGTEAAFLKAIQRQATKRSTGEGSVFGKLAKGLGGGAALEGFSEYAQSEIAIQNRSDYDPTYTQEEKNLRRMESAFAGAVVGGFAGGAGSVGSTLYQKRTSATEMAGKVGSGTAEKTQAIFAKARGMWADSVGKRENDKSDAEESGEQQAQADMSVGQVVTVQKNSVTAGDDILNENEITPDEVTIIRVKKLDSGDIIYLGKTASGSSVSWSDSQLNDGEFTINPSQEQMDALRNERTELVSKRRQKPDTTTSKNASPEQLDLSLGEQTDTAAEMQNTLDDYDSFLQANQTEEPTRRSMETFTPADPDDLDESLISESSRKDLRTFPRSTAPAAKERPDLESAQGEFRTKIGDNLATLAAEDPSNERLVALEKQFREGDNARKDEIMSTLRQERELLEQAVDPDTAEGFRAEMGAELADYVAKNPPLPTEKSSESEQVLANVLARFPEADPQRIRQLTRKAVIENQKNVRLQGLEKKFREGDNETKDDIIRTAARREREQSQSTKPPLEETNDVQEFFRLASEGVDRSKSYVDALGQGFTENVETVSTKGYSRKKDSTKTYKNTEESRAQFEEAFGETDWTSPFYGGMTEAFLRRAAKTVQDDRNSEGEAQSDFDIQNTAKGYVLRKTSFIRDRDEVDDQFIRGAIAEAKRSRYAAGSNVQIVESGLEPRDINLADLTDTGRSLIQDRGNDTYQGDRLTEMSQRGLSEFVSELAELNAQASEKGAPTFDLLIAGKSIFDLTPQDLSGPAGDVNAARVADADITLRELLSTDEDGGSFVTVEYYAGGKKFSIRRVGNSPKGEMLTVQTAKDEIKRLEERGQKAFLELVPKSKVYIVTGEMDFVDGPLQGRSTKYSEADEQSGTNNVTENIPSEQLAPSVEDAPRLSAVELIARRKAVDAYNEAQLRSSMDAARQGAKKNTIEQFFYTAESADRAADSLRRRGYDVSVKEPVLGKESEDINVKSLEEEGSGFSTSNYNKDGLDSTPDPQLPKSRLNIEMNPSRDADRSRVGSSKPLNIDYPFGKPSEMVAEFLDKAIRKIKPTKPVYVIGLKQLQNMRKDQVSARSVSARQGASQTSRRDQMRARFNDDRVADLVAEAADELANNPNKHGEYIGFTNAHIALVDDLNTTNDVEASLVSAHEAIGHVLFNEEIEATLANPVLRQRLERDFEKARRAEKAPWQYQTEHGFEEWFADQTATYALKVYVQGKKPSSGIVSKTFQKIVEKLRKLFQDLSSEFKKRFGKDSYSATFDDYIQNVIVAERANLRRTQRIFPAEVSYKKKAIVRAMEESVSKAPDGPAAVNAMKRNFKQHIDGTATGHTMFKLVLPEDNMLRSISPVIADMMYVRSNSESLGNNQHGFMLSKDHVRSQVYDQLEKMLGTDWETKEVTDAFELAADQTTKTEDLDGKAREIRDWLSDLHDNYISKTPGNTIEKRPDYFPIALNLAAIYTDDAAFTELVLEFNPLLNPEKVRQTVDGLIARQQHVLDDDEVTFKATDPVSVVEQARVLTENIPHDRLKPFIEAPEAALLKYMRHVITRSEWKRSTHDDEGKDLLALELVKLPEAKRKEAVATLERYLGYTKSPLNPTLSKAMSWMQLFNWVTLLPAATIGSIPELGGAIVNTREFAGFGMAKNAILSRMQNPEQAIQLARTIGVTHSTVMGNLGLTEADAEYLDPRVRKYSDKFFSVIGLDWFTRYTREFASVLSVDFLVEHAFNKNKNPRAERYLSIHGVTADQVKSWHARQEDGGHYTFDGDDGAAVMSAMQRFVSNSMLKPNAAERTSWGNDPKYQLIWALKSYLMSFGKVILGGVKREMAARLAEGDTTLEKLSSVGMMGVLTLAAFMPLAALSLELREIAKAGLAGVLPGVDANARYFRSDRMDTMTYMGELFDRGGLAGPFAILGMVTKSASWGEAQGLGPVGQIAKGLAPILGPTYGFLVDDIGLGLAGGKGWEVVPARIIPGYSLVI